MLIMFLSQKFICAEGGKSPSHVDFFPNSVKNPLSDIIHLVSVVGPVGRASACRSIGRGFEPGL